MAHHLDQEAMGYNPAYEQGPPPQQQQQQQQQSHSTYDFTPGLAQPDASPAPNDTVQRQHPAQAQAQAQVPQYTEEQIQRARAAAQQQNLRQMQLQQMQLQQMRRVREAQMQAQAEADAQEAHAQAQAEAQEKAQQEKAQQEKALQAQFRHSQEAGQYAQLGEHARSHSGPHHGHAHSHGEQGQSLDAPTRNLSQELQDALPATTTVSRGGGEYPTLNHSPGAKWIKHLTRSRLDTFTGGHYADVNLSSVLFTRKEDGPEYVKLKVWSAPGLSKPSFEEAMQQKFKSAKKGDSFGPSWTNHWWKVAVYIPEDFKQYERVQFEFDPGCEAMVFSTSGVPLQGITGGFGGDRRVDHIIPRSAIECGVYEFVIESSCNGMFGVPWNGDTIAPPDMNRYFALASADLVVPNQEAWRLLWDFEALKQVVESVGGNTVLQNKALIAANEIMNVFGRGDLAGIKRARKLAEDVFGEGWEKKGADIYKEGDQRASVWGIGHCHIDTAWLWPYRVTQQKVARSWSTQIDLMERYPEHRFAASSAQQYKWLEQQYPQLFKKIQKKVKEGKFHVVGGSWVENDSNMPSGEALVRQFLYGQRYFESRFGVRCETAWLPDSFGLTGALPQLIRGSGMKYFFTQKLSWNNINTFPHSSFNWVGLDGTQVLCHMTPVDTYTAQATVGDVKKGIENHKNLESSDTALLVFGNGDGGGGPLNKMLENLRRIRAVTNTHRELPPVSMGSSVDQFFGDLEEKSEEGAKLPNWHGELYLEFHRGTYTSHGSIKKGNRHSEVLLRDVELLASLASVSGREGYVYPKREIDECWEKVLLNQFHDVLPGSSIGMVYEDAEKLYGEVKHTGEALLEEALSVLFPSSASLSPFPYQQSRSHSRALSASTKLVVFNTTFLPRVEVVKVPLVKMSKEVKSMVLQARDDGKEGYAVVACTEGAAAGEVVSPSNRLRSKLMPVSVYTNGSDHFVLRNSSVQLTIAEGRITSLLDVKTDRELIAKGQTGGLVIFQDRPNYWDAWDVEVHHLEVSEQLKFENVSVVAQGPVFGAVRAEVKYGQSTIVITISLSATGATSRDGSRSLFNFDAQVDWHQRHEFLKFELPLDIHSDHATYETQFGHLQRPTHKNTTWDMAKFEVCAHKFADLSEFGYGLAILSESKYGFSCLGNVLRISLLRGATAPDAEQDQGEHSFSWGVYPHVGGFLESDVPVAGFLYNSPVRVRALPPSTANKITHHAPFSIEGSRNVFLETVKRGEDDAFDDSVNLEDVEDFVSHKKGKSTLVLRLYEAYGGHGTVALKVSRNVPVVKAFITNLLEDHEEELDIEKIGEIEGSLSSTVTEYEGGARIKLRFRGFEVKTVKLILGSKGDDDLACGLGSKEESGPTYPPPPSEKRGKRSSWVDVDEDQLAL